MFTCKKNAPFRFLKTFIFLSIFLTASISFGQAPATLDDVATKLDELIKISNEILIGLWLYIGLELAKTFFRG